MKIIRAISGAVLSEEVFGYGLIYLAADPDRPSPQNKGEKPPIILLPCYNERMVGG